MRLSILNQEINLFETHLIFIEIIPQENEEWPSRKRHNIVSRIWKIDFETAIIMKLFLGDVERLDSVAVLYSI